MAYVFVIVVVVGYRVGQTPDVLYVMTQEGVRYIKLFSSVYEVQ